MGIDVFGMIHWHLRIVETMINKIGYDLKIGAF